LTRAVSALTARVKPSRAGRNPLFGAGPPAAPPAYDTAI